MTEDIYSVRIFSEDFQNFLRSKNFPEVFFMNTYGYTNALRSEQYNYLIAEYKKLSDTF